MDKATLRATLRQARRELPPDYVAAAGAAICQHVEQLPCYRAADTVLTYVSMENEVDTHRLIGGALAAGRRVLVPRAGAGGRMDWVRLGSLSELRPGRFGILEAPASHPPEKLPGEGAVVLVPGLCFRPDGHRIGYGGGFFDRFLSDWSLPSVGLAYARLLGHDWQPDPHDVPVTHRAQDDGVYLSLKTDN